VLTGGGTGVLNREGGFSISDAFYVGNVKTSEGLRAFRTRLSDENRIELDPLSGFNASMAISVNDDGTVLGLSVNTTTNASKITRWGGTSMNPTDYGTGSAGSISDGGTIVGTVNNQAVRFVNSLANIPLGTLGGAQSQALDINSSGQIVGASLDAQGRRKPFYFAGAGTLVDLAPTWTSGQANAINDGGTIVGEVGNRAFSFRNSTLSLLPQISIGSGQTSSALDINTGRETVGLSVSGSTSAATYWDATGAAFNLNSLVIGVTDVALTRAVSINTQGQILAWGVQGGQARTYLLTPATSALDASGLLTVNGTAGADTIDLSISGANLVVRVGNTTQSFTTTQVRRINVLAGDGGDRVTIGTGVIGTYVDGAGGNDTINGGQFADTLTGGAGKNFLYGNDGGDRLNGSGGRDYLYGGNGDDFLYGNGGDDFLYGQGNVDRIFGGAGNDRLDGGNGADKLYAEAGLDVLIGGGGTDILDGGADSDLGKTDVGDSFIDIETRF
jgi:Ca2+-binding RTX toxin-like protein